MMILVVGCTKENYAMVAFLFYIIQGALNESGEKNSILPTKTMF